MRNVIKKYSIIIFFVTKITASQVPELPIIPDIYLYNAYGACIVYKTDIGKETSLEDRTAVKLFTIYNHAPLFIRTTSKLSRFTHLAECLKQIQQEAPNNPGLDAYICINPSKLYEPWNISITWLSGTFDEYEYEYDEILSSSADYRHEDPDSFDFD